MVSPKQKANPTDRSPEAYANVKVDESLKVEVQKIEVKNPIEDDIRALEVDGMTYEIANGIFNLIKGYSNAKTMEDLLENGLARGFDRKILRILSQIEKHIKF